MDITYLIIVLGVLLLSMTLHEMMHAFVGYWLGDDTAKLEGRISFNPLRHLDPFLSILLPLFLAAVGGPIFGGAKPVPFNPQKVKGGEWGAALVAVAGPLTNLVLAFLFFAFGVATGVISTAGIQQTIFGTIIMAGVGVNLGFFVFNMLPIPPLDGSRVLYALAPEFVRRIMEMIEGIGIVVVFALILIASAPLGQLMGGAISGLLEAFMFVFRLG